MGHLLSPPLAPPICEDTDDCLRFSTCPHTHASPGPEEDVGREHVRRQELPGLGAVLMPALAGGHLLNPSPAQQDGSCHQGQGGPPKGQVFLGGWREETGRGLPNPIGTGPSPASPHSGHSRGPKGMLLHDHRLPGGPSLEGCRQVALGGAPRNQSLCSPRNSGDNGALPQPLPTLRLPAWFPFWKPQG